MVLVSIHTCVCVSQNNLDVGSRIKFTLSGLCQAWQQVTLLVLNCPFSKVKSWGWEGQAAWHQVSVGGVWLSVSEIFGGEP